MRRCPHRGQYSSATSDEQFGQHDDRRSTSRQLYARPCGSVAVLGRAVAVLLEAERAAVLAVFLQRHCAVRLLHADRVTRAGVRGPSRMIAIRAPCRLDVIGISLGRHLRILLRQQCPGAERTGRRGRAETEDEDEDDSRDHDERTPLPAYCRAAILRGISAASASAPPVPSGAASGANRTGQEKSEAPSVYRGNSQAGSLAPTGD